MAINPNMKTLIVDDMNTMRKIVKGMFEKLGFKNLKEASDGKPAWELIQEAVEEGAPFEFIVSDWNMPGMTGIELLRKVRAFEATKKVPFLMVTAEGEKSNVLEAVKAGVSNYVVKPFTPDTLKEKLDKIFK